eukprot:102466_1
MCKMKIKYDYDNNNVFVRHYTTVEAKKILFNKSNLNLILQHIDQRLLDKLQNGLRIYINLEIKYQYMDGNADKSQVRIWRYNLSDYFKVLEIGNVFNWKITDNTILNNEPIYPSSLWITNKSHFKCINDKYHLFRVLCKKEIWVDDDSCISINGHGDGGTIIVLCDKLIIENKGAIRANGYNAQKYNENPGSGGSILIFTNDVDPYRKHENDEVNLRIRKLPLNIEDRLFVNGGKGHENGIDGIVRFGFISKHNDDATNPEHDGVCRSYYGFSRYYGNECCQCGGQCHNWRRNINWCICHSYGCCNGCACKCYCLDKVCCLYKEKNLNIKYYKKFSRVDVEIPFKYNWIYDHVDDAHIFKQVIFHPIDIKNVGHGDRNENRCFHCWHFSILSLLILISILILILL